MGQPQGFCKHGQAEVSVNPPGAASNGPSPTRDASERKAPAPGPAGWAPGVGAAGLGAGRMLAGGGLVIADTAVQDVAFVMVAVFFAQLGGRAIRAWQFGLRTARLRRSIAAPLLAGVAFLVFLAIWSGLVHAGKEKLLETLGTRQSTILLVSSAALTCVLAPICEEFLFRGF